MEDRPTITLEIVLQPPCATPKHTLKREGDSPIEYGSRLAKKGSKGKHKPKKHRKH